MACCENACTIVWLWDVANCRGIQLSNTAFYGQPQLNELGYFTLDACEADLLNRSEYFAKGNVVQTIYDCDGDVREYFWMLGGHTFNPTTGLDQWFGYSLNVLLRNAFTVYPDGSPFVNKSGPADTVMHEFVEENRGGGIVTNYVDPTAGQVSYVVAIERCECAVVDDAFTADVEAILAANFPPEWNYTDGVITLDAGTVGQTVNVCFDSICDCFKLSIGDVSAEFSDRCTPAEAFDVCATADEVLQGDDIEYCIKVPSTVTADTTFTFDISGNGSLGTDFDSGLSAATAGIPNLIYTPFSPMATASITFEAGYTGGDICWLVPSVGTGDVTVTLNSDDVDNIEATATVTRQIKTLTTSDEFAEGGDTVTFTVDFTPTLAADCVCNICATGCLADVIVDAIDAAGYPRNGLQVTFPAGLSFADIPVVLPAECSGEATLTVCGETVTVFTSGECAEQISMGLTSPDCVQISICDVPEAIELCVPDVRAGQVITSYKIERNGMVPDLWEGNRPNTNLLSLLQSIGTAYDVDFAVTMTEDCEFEFCCSYPQLGEDRTVDSPNPLLLSDKLGNLTVERFRESWLNEVHIVHAVAQDGTCATCHVDNLADVPDWCKREVVVTSNRQTTPEALKTLARETLAQRRATVEIDFDLTDVCDVDLGDRFSVVYNGTQFDYKVTQTPFEINGFGWQWQTPTLEITSGGVV